MDTLTICARGAIGGFGGSVTVTDVDPLNFSLGEYHVRVTSTDAFGDVTEGTFLLAAWQAAIRAELDRNLGSIGEY